MIADTNVVVEEELPVTTLQLVLRSATPTLGGQSRAIIELPNGKQAVIAEGEDIMTGVVLERVETWRALINRRGSREILPLKNRPEIGDEWLDPGMLSSPTMELSEPSTQTPLKTETSSVSGVSLADLAGPLMPQLSAFGFQPTDIPVAINGEPIPSDADQWEAMMLSAQSNEQVMITIERDGQRQEIAFSLAQVGEF